MVAAEAATISERVMGDKRGETCRSGRGSGIMLQGQREGSMKSNAKGRRRVVEGRGGREGGGRRRRRR